MAPLILIAFFFVVILMFCIRPIRNCLRVCFCGVPKQLVQENRLVVQSSDIAQGTPVVSDSEEELRKSAQVGALPLESPYASTVEASAELRVAASAGATVLEVIGDPDNDLPYGGFVQGGLV